MDPKECLRLADQYISDGRYIDAHVQLAEYWRWRAKGGFQPFEVAGTTKLGDVFARECRTRLETATLPVNRRYTLTINTANSEMICDYPSLDAALVYARERVDSVESIEHIFCEDNIGNSWTLREENGVCSWQASETIDKIYPIDELPVSRAADRTADHIDGYDRDDIGESPDY